MDREKRTDIQQGFAISIAMKSWESSVSIISSMLQNMIQNTKGKIWEH